MFYLFLFNNKMNCCANKTGSLRRGNWSPYFDPNMRVTEYYRGYNCLGNAWSVAGNITPQNHAPFTNKVLSFRRPNDLKEHMHLSTNPSGYSQFKNY